MAVDPKTILSDIERAALDRLKTKGLPPVHTFEIKKEGENVYATPAVRAIIADGKFTLLGQKTYRCDVNLYAVILFKHVSDEESRRKGIYPIMMGAINLLAGQTLGLGIRELEPGPFREITSARDVDAGLIVFQVQFGTRFTFELLDDEVAADLLTIGISYYLQEPAPPDATADLTGEVSL